MRRYRNSNPVPTTPLADDIATSPSGAVACLTLLLITKSLQNGSIYKNYNVLPLRSAPGLYKMDDTKIKSLFYDREASCDTKLKHFPLLRDDIRNTASITICSSRQHKFKWPSSQKVVHPLLETTSTALIKREEKKHALKIVPYPILLFVVMKNKIGVPLLLWRMY